MAWLDLSTEIDDLFSACLDSLNPVSCVFEALGSTKSFIFLPDRHEDADRFIAAGPEERAEMHSVFEQRRLELVKLRATYEASEKLRKLRARIRDPHTGRNLIIRSGKVTRELRDRILNLARSTSQRAIATKLELSRPTVARVLGKSWGEDRHSKPRGKPGQPPKITWPSKSELEHLVRTFPLTTIAEKLGVSAVAVGKHCRKQGITLPGPGYWTRMKSLTLPK